MTILNTSSRTNYFDDHYIWMYHDPSFEYYG